MKKPALKSATPNDDDANALYDDAGHDLLTEAFSDPSRPNRVLVVGIVSTAEAGGHDANGDRVTKYKFDHLEAAFTDTDTKKLTDLLVTMHKRRR